jgi:sortase A
MGISYKKNRWRFSSALLVAGILVIIFPLLTEIYGLAIQDRLNKEWETELAAQKEQAVAVESRQVERLGELAVSTEESVIRQAVSPLERLNHEGFPATKIIIPKIGAEQVVLPGVDGETLKSGPGHYPGTAYPGEPGNMGIAGHRVTYTKPFNRLDELEAGDQILIETLDTIYEYRVIWSKVLEPDDLSALMPPDDGSARLTLTTCTPKYSARYRLDVQATLVGQTSRQPPTPGRLVGRLSEPRQSGVSKNFFKRAVDEGREAVAARPTDYMARISLGAGYRNMGRDREAVEQLKKAVELKPDYPLAYYQLALVYEKIGRFDDATSALRLAVNVEPDFEPAYFTLGRLYLDLDQVDHAIELLETAVGMNNLSADTRYLLATAYEKKGHRDLARREYRETLRFLPDFDEARAGLKRVSGPLAP